LSSVQFQQLKPFRRRLFNGLAALSLVLFVAMTALWARSYFAVEAVFRTHWDAPAQRLSNVDIGWSDGEVTAYYGRLAPPAQGFFPPPNIGWQHSTTHSISAGDAWWHIKHQPRTAFRGANGTLGWNENWNIAFRISPVAALAALLPGCWLLTKTRRKHSQPTGLCPDCGYDLRATPDRCPECGTVPPKSKA
jgi:hypothetical protein